MSVRHLVYSNMQVPFHLLPMAHMHLFISTNNTYEHPKRSMASYKKYSHILTSTNTHHNDSKRKFSTKDTT